MGAISSVNKSVCPADSWANKRVSKKARIPLDTLWVLPLDVSSDTKTSAFDLRCEAYI